MAWSHGLLKNRPWHRVCDFLYLRIGSILCTKYFIYSYVLIWKGICENLMNITQITGEIWTLLILWITLKIARLRHQNYYYFCIVEEVTHSYCLAKFLYNWKKQWGNMDKTVNWRPKNGHQFKVGTTQGVNSITYLQNYCIYFNNTTNSYQALLCLIMCFKLIKNIPCVRLKYTRHFSTWT